MNRSALVALVVWSVCLGICLPAQALDYKTWLPLLPETLGGMSRESEPDGMNMEMQGKAWASVSQEYQDSKSERSVTLVLIAGSAAPQIEGFKNMPKATMETGDMIWKSVEIGGYQGILQIEKKEHSATVMIGVDDQSLVMINCTEMSDEKEVLALAKELPLSKFAARMK